MKIILFSLLFSINSFAASDSERRAADLLEGTQVLVNLSDPVLLDEREREWVLGSGNDGTRCKLSISSHFDREQADTSGKTLYVVTQVHNGNYFSNRREESRDQFNFWLTTENKDLPMLGFDCFRIASNPNAKDRALTFRSVSELIGMPDFFHKVVFKKDASRLVMEITPRVKKIKTLVPLRFSSVKKPDGRSSLPTSPAVQFGKVLKEDEKLAESSFCRISISGSQFDSGEYDYTLPEGSDFSFEYFSSFYFRDSEYLAFRGNDGLTYFEISCSSRKGVFKDFAEIQNHLKGIIDLL